MTTPARRFCHTDNNIEDGLAIVSRLLKLASLPPRENLFYDLSFYSGGIGVLDRLAIALKCDQAMWAHVTTALNAKTPEEACRDQNWAEEFLWLITDDESKPLPPRELAAEFINSERDKFQPECRAENRLYFVDESDVNSWCALWGTHTQMNYLGYDQG